jgi:hypothetical protein
MGKSCKHGSTDGVELRHRQALIECVEIILRGMIPQTAFE